MECKRCQWLDSSTDMFLYRQSLSYPSVASWVNCFIPRVISLSWPCTRTQAKPKNWSVRQVTLQSYPIVARCCSLGGSDLATPSLSPALTTILICCIKSFAQLFGCACKYPTGLLLTVGIPNLFICCISAP